MKKTFSCKNIWTDNLLDCLSVCRREPPVSFRRRQAYAGFAENKNAKHD